MTHSTVDARSRWLPPGTVLQFGALLAILSGIGFAMSQGDMWSLESWSQHEEQLRVLHRDRPVAVYGGAFLLYVGVTACSLPFATALSCSFAWLFGFAPAFVVVSFASTSGATLAFLLCRHLIGARLQARFADQLAGFNRALARDGPWYLLTLRLTAVVPFFAVNALAGLTRMRVWTFWWVSQLGMLPGTCLYVYAGSSFPHLDHLAEHGVRGIITPRIFLALILLGLFPLLIKKTVDRFNRTRPSRNTNTDSV